MWYILYFLVTIGIAAGVKYIFHWSDTPTVILWGVLFLGVPLMWYLVTWLHHQSTYYGGKEGDMAGPVTDKELLQRLPSGYAWHRTSLATVMKPEYDYLHYPFVIHYPHDQLCRGNGLIYYRDGENGPVYAAKEPKTPVPRKHLEITQENKESLMTLAEIMSARDRGVEPDTHWRHLDLSGLNLHGLDLHGLDLSWANLQGTDLSLADLSGADLHNAKLNNANIAGAKLDNAILKETVMPSGTIHSS